MLKFRILRGFRQVCANHLQFTVGVGEEGRRVAYLVRLNAPMPFVENLVLLLPKSAESSVLEKNVNRKIISGSSFLSKPIL